jgi:hypothetical protein
MSRWERVVDGEGQVALIIGEAGIGKSRLVQRFHEQIAGTPHTWIETAAGAFFQNTPFYPVAEMLKQALGWRGDDPAEQQLAQLESPLELAGLKPAEAIPLLAPLLDMPLAVQYQPSTLSPEQQRRRLLATLVELALGIARAQPTVITTEDLHWVDPSTLELIQLLVEQATWARLLLLYTARPEFRAQWPLRAHHTQITLNRLSSRNVRTMVGQVAAQKALSEATIATLVIDRIVILGHLPLCLTVLSAPADQFPSASVAMSCVKALDAAAGTAVEGVGALAGSAAHFHLERPGAVAAFAKLLAQLDGRGELRPDSADQVFGLKADVASLQGAVGHEAGAHAFPKTPVHHLPEQHEGNFGVAADDVG